MCVDHVPIFSLALIFICLIQLPYIIYEFDRSEIFICFCMYLGCIMGYTEFIGGAFLGVLCIASKVFDKWSKRVFS